MTMTVAPPPEPETIEPPAYPPQSPVAPPAYPPPTPTPVEPPEHKLARPRGVVAGLILIAFGLVVLAGNVLPTPGGLLFLGLGAAFLAARVITGRPGYAVPAGLLLGFGAFVGLSESGVLAGRDTGGLFFIMLGLGFVALYLIGAAPSRVWPLIPAASLIGFGLLLQGAALGWSLVPFVWLAAYWPLALVAIGLWLLVRDQLPPAWRSPVTVVGASGLILVGFLVAAGGMASIAAPTARFTPFPVWPGFQTMLGMPSAQDTLVLSAPIGPGDTLRVNNISGRTTIRATTDDQVRVEVVRHYWPSTNPPDVRVVPTAGTVTVESTQTFSGPGAMGYVDYVIDVPASTNVDVGSASGDITANGMNGAVALHTISGSIIANDLGGDSTLTTTSGDIRASNVDRVREARSVSGDIDVAGAFAADSAVGTTSGGVTLRFEPGASVRIDATALSGDINARGAGLPSSAGSIRTRTLTVGSGAAHMTVRTTSGDITLIAP